MRAARPKKKKIIARNKAYHGVTLASASLTGLANNHKSFDLPFDFARHADLPHFYRGAEPGETRDGNSPSAWRPTWMR